MTEMTKKMESRTWEELPEVYRLAVILVICVIGAVDEKYHHYHSSHKIWNGVIWEVFFYSCQGQYPAALPEVSVARASEQGQEIHQPLWQTFPGYSGDLDKIYRPFLQPAIWKQWNTMRVITVVMC